jgi:hypothetical protein
MKPLFFIGNRRSGTSVMTYVLNQHRRIFMADEADTLWFLFSGGVVFAHKDDEGQGSITSRSKNKESFLEYTELTGTVRENFFKDVLHIRDNGIFSKQEAYPEKRDVVWAGDKKPAQTTDPRMRPWIESNFPDAKYIHLVRDPVHCIASMVGLGWAGNVEFLTDYYIRLEQQALEIPDRLFVRHEDVCENPMRELCRISEYLDLDEADIIEDYDASGYFKLKRGVVMGKDYAMEARRADLEMIPLTDELKRLMEIYGY